MKGRCYLRTPSPYFIQYTGDNEDEVINFLHEIDAPIDIDCYEIKEIEIDGEKLLNFMYDDGFYKEDFSVNVGSFIVIDDADSNNINEYSEYEFHHSFRIDDDIAENDEVISNHTPNDDDTFTVHYTMYPDGEPVKHNIKISRIMVQDVTKNDNGTAYLYLTTTKIHSTDNYDDVVKWWEGGKK